MSNLDETIRFRHGRDRWKDAIFIGAAVLLTALSIAAVTARSAGKHTERAWSVQMVETPDILQK